MTDVIDELTAEPQRGRLTTVAAIRQFLLGGNATVTLQSQRTCARFTYRIRKSEDGKVYFVAVMYGSDNESEYKYLGIIRTASGAYEHGRKSKVKQDSTPAKAFAWFYALVAAGRMPPEMEVWHEGRCACCGRKLTVPESIERGIGPDCWAAMQEAA